MYIKNLIFDRRHIWHPYSTLLNPISVYPVIFACGYKFKLSNGDYLIDGISSWWSSIYGYNNLEINKIINFQINNLSHIMFGNISHKISIDLCNNLINLSPKGLESVFLCDSGSLSIEVAIKIVIQYWNIVDKFRYKFLTINFGYHGDTLSSMSLCYFKNVKYNFYKKYFFSNIFLNISNNLYENWNNFDIDLLYNLFDTYYFILAGLILEPIVQFAGGFRFYHSEYLYHIRLLCDYYDVIFIVDEIATGFGRTGELFASDFSGITPDIMCLGKSLTGGIITLSAVLIIRRISDIISSNDIRYFMHGHTYMANPLACSIANANITLFKKEIWYNQINNIFVQLKLGLLNLIYHPKVKSVRILGSIGVIETFQLISISNLQRFFISKGVWIRPFSNFIYLMPSYIISDLSLKKIIDILYKSLEIESNFII